ncbi:MULTISPECIES: hypothetical protein [Streptomyces]|uniref:hypothetical protein n=1 Tax=Streptomyces TaxID=1883 RepID=UPI0036B79EA8
MKRPAPGSGPRLAKAVVSVAALATTGWSLYAVARHYEAPKPIAVGIFAVFDGIAYAALHLASEASAAGRSAFGARLTAFGMAGVSVYLNRFHADLIHGGLPAALLFAIPTIGLLLLSELSWAGPRAAARAERGAEQPYRLPAFGGWAWALAPHLAGKTVRSRAIAHIMSEPEPPAPAAPEPPARHSATEVLRRRFAEMDPADAIRVAHDAQPDMPPADLASLLVTYGVIVDAVQVALVLHDQPERITVDRDDTDDTDGDTPPDTGDTPQVSPPALTKKQAVLDALTALGPEGFTPKDVVDRVRRINRLDVKPDYVRTVRHRAQKDQQADGGDRPMEGGYA